MAFVNSNVKKN